MRETPEESSINASPAARTPRAGRRPPENNASILSRENVASRISASCAHSQGFGPPLGEAGRSVPSYARDPPGLTEWEGGSGDRLRADLDEDATHVRQMRPPLDRGCPRPPNVRGANRATGSPVCRSRPAGVEASWARVARKRTRGRRGGRLRRHLLALSRPSCEPAGAAEATAMRSTGWALLPAKFRAGSAGPAAACHPLICHMLDVARVAERLWSSALTPAARSAVAEGLGTDKVRRGSLGGVPGWPARPGEGCPAFLQYPAVGAQSRSLPSRRTR